MFKKQFPADFITEAIDQTRGWFYTLLAISTALGKRAPYKNVLCYGHVLDDKGKKMSKSVGNIIDPWDVINTFGADATRWFFYTVNRPGDSKNFSYKDVEEKVKGYLMTLRNSLRFLQLYTGNKIVKKIPQPKTYGAQSLDAWILSRLHSTIKIVTDSLDAYDPMVASRALEAFVMNDLSNWWIRRSRPRFQKPRLKKEREDAIAVLRYVLLEAIRLSAPFTPFVAEHMYRRLTSAKESVHLETWPKTDRRFINRKLEKDMDVAREIVAAGLARRREHGLKVRQPLALATINKKVPPALHQYIADELNVKKVVFRAKQSAVAKLDTHITDELRAEGFAREILRSIQELRKKAGFEVTAIVQGFWSTDDRALAAVVAQYEKEIAEDTLLKKFELKSRAVKTDAAGEYRFGEANLWIGVKG